MSEREVLINEIKGLPNFMIEQLLGIVRYLKLGIENEYVSKIDKDFYNSEQFKKIVSESLIEYRSGKTEDMDILCALARGMEYRGGKNEKTIHGNCS